VASSTIQTGAADHHGMFTLEELISRNCFIALFVILEQS